MLKKAILSCAVAMAAMVATPAAAAETMCSNTDIVPTALDCSGFYAGNLLNSANIAAQQAALAELGFTWDGAVTMDKVTDLAGANINFDTLLQGITYIGVHFGNGKGGPGNATAFYKIDAGTGLDQILLNYRASSNAVLYSTTAAVPEPATWAMMFVGFGLVGGLMRSRRRHVAPRFA